MLCKNCSTKCQDDESLEIECPNCNGDGCSFCRDGRVEITGCPQKQIDTETKQVLEFSDWIEKGYLPCSGGILDQSSGLMAHCKAYSNEVNRIEAERWKKQ